MKPKLHMNVFVNHNKTAIRRSVASVIICRGNRMLVKTWRKNHQKGSKCTLCTILSCHVLKFRLKESKKERVTEEKNICTKWYVFFAGLQT